MKVLYLITKSNFGGAQRYVYSLGTRLSKDHEVVVAFGGHGELEQKLQNEKVRTISLPNLERDMNAINDIRAFFSILFLLRKERPDIVHVNSSKIGGIGALAGRCAGIPKIIFTAHGWAFNEDRGPVSKAIIRFLSWLTILLSTDVITLSQKELLQATDFPLVPARKVHLIPIGIEQFELLSRNEALQLLPEHTGSTTIIGTIAELHTNKNLKELIIAFSSIVKDGTDARLLLIGEGEDKKELLKLAQKHDIASHVVFAGYVDDARRYLTVFDIFVLPSKKEGLPYVILEAGMAKVPVIASAVGGIPETIQDGVSGILVQPRSTDILTALRHLLKSPQERNNLGSALHKDVLARFSIDKMVAQTIHIYHSDNKRQL